MVIDASPFPQRWVLIRPRNRSPFFDPEIYEPLGLQYLDAVLRQRGAKVLLLDAILENQPDFVLGRRAAAFQPDVIGFSLTTAQEIPSLESIWNAARENLGNRPVRWVSGGNFVTSEPEQARQLLPSAFTLVRFEGEGILADLSAFDGVRPLCGSAVEDLDALPFPARPYAEAILGVTGCLSLQGSRGCCGDCAYCASPGIWPKESRRWRGRSPGHIVEELVQLQQRFGASCFNFVDEDFFGPPHSAADRARALTQEIQRRNLHVSFGIQARPVSLQRESLEPLVGAGLSYVFLGLESDDPADFQRWGRPWAGDPWRWIEDLKAMGIRVDAGTLLFHPRSTFQSVKRMAERLRSFGLLGWRTAVNRLDAMPGSRMYHQALNAGILSRDIAGPQRLPLEEPGLEGFHEQLVRILAPLEAPSLRAVCMLPPLVAICRADDRLRGKLESLDAILETLNTAVNQSLFDLLDRFQDPDLETWVRIRTEDNQREAQLAEEKLMEKGFVPQGC